MSKTKKIGRPRKNAKEVKTKYVCVPMNAYEFKYVSRLAKKSEKRLATFIRESLLTFVSERER